MRELAILYPAFLAGASSPLEELPIQLVDYAQWERQKEFDREVGYWKQQLGGDFEAVELPLSQPRHADASSQGGSVSVSIDAPTVEKIRNFCLRHEITMFMFMVAAFKALLHEYTGKQEITLGIPESGRNRREIEGLIGSFANTLVLRTPVTAEISFTQLVQRVRKVVLESYEHRDMPYAKLLSMLGRGMPSEDNPLFRMMIDLVVGNNDVKAPQASLEVKTLEPEPESLVIGNDLTFLIKEQNSELEAALLYKTALFEKTLIRQVLNRFNVLVHKVLEYPEHLLSSFKHQRTDKQAV
jgi:non-ribosomal peptide synthetase component F